MLKALKEGGRRKEKGERRKEKGERRRTALEGGSRGDEALINIVKLIRS
jgi:hypothetical protein